MKKVATLLLITILQAQPNAIWIRTFGGINSDYGRSIQQVFNDGYILIGTTASFGNNNNAWLIKIDAEGNQEWDKTFGGSNDDFGSCIQHTIDGGYIIVGWTNSFGGGNNDAWLIKTDAEGNEEWDKPFGGSDSDRGYSVQQTTDGGYIITGETKSFGNGESDLWLIKTDAQGNGEWNKPFGGSDSDRGYAVQQTENNEYVITGWTKSFGNGNNDAWLIKIENPLAEIDDSFIPNIFVFHQNYPNPFNPITLLEYDLPKDELVNITMYDMKGRMFKTITNGLNTAGYKSVHWNATNDRNETVSAGVYLYSIQACLLYTSPSPRDRG